MIRRRNNRVLFALYAAVWLLLFSTALLADELNAAHLAWLEDEVAHIISDEEIKLFLSLETSEERERFIQAFWKAKDPTIGTETNEYKEEHYRRFRYAGDSLGAGGKKGWTTDMGKIYILLGQPRETLRFDSSKMQTTVEAWLYPPDWTCGIRYNFYIVFCKNPGRGDYMLYRPDKLGPGVLLKGRNVEPQPRQDVDALNSLLKIDILLAQLALSLIPAEHRPIMMNNSAEIRRALSNRSRTSEKMLQTILNSRNMAQSSRIKDLRKVLNSVEPEAPGPYTLMKLIPPYRLHVLKDNSGNTNLYLSILMDTGSISMKEFHERSYAVFDIHFTAVDTDGRLAAEKIEKVTASFDSWRVRQGSTQRLLYEGALRLRSGRYKALITVRNLFSRTYFEISEEIEAPPYWVGALTFGSPVLSASRKRINSRAHQVSRPYQFHGQEYFPLADMECARDKDTNIYYQLYFPRHDRSSRVRMTYQVFAHGKLVWQKAENLARGPLRNGNLFSHYFSIPRDSLPVGKYTLVITAESTYPPSARTSLEFMIAGKERDRTTLVHASVTK